MNDLQIVALEQMDITTWDFERIKVNLESALSVYCSRIQTIYNSIPKDSIM